VTFVHNLHILQHLEDILLPAPDPETVEDICTCCPDNLPGDSALRIRDLVPDLLMDPVMDPAYLMPIQLYDVLPGDDLLHSMQCSVCVCVLGGGLPWFAACLNCNYSCHRSAIRVIGVNLQR